MLFRELHYNKLGKKMKKSQLVSMDFIIAFVVFIFALSFFFFTLGNASSYENINLDAPAELMFSRMDQLYDQNYDFLDGSIVDAGKFDRYIDDKTPREVYDFIFRDFDDPSFFTKIDYCVFLENRTPQKSQIIRNFAASPGGNYSIRLADSDCGENKYFIFTGILPRCEYGEEALSIIKPVRYNQDIMNLRVLLCAQKR